MRSGSSYLDLGAGVASVLSSNATLRIQEIEAETLQCGASMLCQLASAEAGGDNMGSVHAAIIRVQRGLGMRGTWEEPEVDEWRRIVGRNSLGRGGVLLPLDGIAVDRCSGEFGS